VRKLPQKIRELITKIKNAGFTEIGGGGKGSHRKFTHKNFPGAVTISGKSGSDAKHYQIKQVDQAIERVKS
jgi:predicted RNA binding protein YcfA (HicA-like mRNA interferase family)